MVLSLVFQASIKEFDSPHSLQVSGLVWERILATPSNCTIEGVATTKVGVQFKCHLRIMGLHFLGKKVLRRSGFDSRRWLQFHAEFA